MTDRSRAWRRQQTRRVMNKILETRKWIEEAVIMKRKSERPAPLAGMKPHKHGKLTRIQTLRQSLMLNYELRDDGMAA